MIAENDLIVRQLKALKTKKAAATAAAKAKRGPKKLDEAQMKEVRDRFYLLFDKLFTMIFNIHLFSIYG